MPTYDYECRTCSHGEEVYQSFSDKPLTTCPKCGEEQYRRVILTAPRISVKGEPTTIGQLSDRNTSKMGRYELQAREQADDIAGQLKQKEDRQTYKKINSMTAAQKKKYIEEG